MKQIKSLFFWASSFIVLAFLTSTSLVFAAQSSDVKNDIQNGIDSAAGSSGGSPATNLNNTIHNIINILSTIVGVVAVIVLIIGALRYVTSGGSEQNVAAAKKTILYAIIGLIIAVLAQVIVRFVLGKATGK